MSCRSCGQDFPKTNGRQVFCSPKCRSELYATVRRDGKPPRGERTCVVCGGKFRLRWSRKTCSPECLKAATRKHSDKQCQHCGNLFYRRRLSDKNDSGRFCSRSCAFGFKRRRSLAKQATEALERSRRLQDRLFRSEVLALRAEVARIRWCPQCKRTFTASSGSQKLCSEDCKAARRREANGKSRKKRRALGFDDRGKFRKRARRYGVAYEPIARSYVMERDAWTCGLCGKAINRRASVPHPRSGVIDHIIPFARGGPHIKTNVQAAHFMCNSLKGAGSYGEQLLLLG